MPYSDRDYKVSNVNYLNKDFNSLKSTLIEYAKTYFPNSYRDFNETSPGMMLIEMSAYVGDVLSYYIDKQYKEMMLPLAEERRNVINIANMLGYKVKPTAPAYVDLKFTQTISTVGSTDVTPNYSEATTIAKGAEVQSTSNTAIKFETLDIVDFTISSSSDPTPTPSAFDSNGVVTSYDLVRKVKAISAETKTKTFTVGSPTKFLTLTLPETNVVDITEVKDSNGNIWYEVDYLAQEYIASEIHYSSDDTRETGYSGLGGTGEGASVESVAVPYRLQYIRSSKRFATEINEDNTTSLVFGNGILRSGQTIGSEFLQTEQAGIIIPGEIDPFTQAVDPLVSDSKSTLGETPSNITLTVTYRVGGGINSNVASEDLTTLNESVTGTVSVTNELPARGGSIGETIEEIRQRAKAYFASQNRCVTQEDYEARVLAMPAKFGNIAKVLVSRNTDTTIDTAGQDDDNPLNNINIFTLSYDNNKHLTRVGDDSPLLVNLKNYLDQFRIMTDEIILEKGFIVNFGVAFDVVAHKTANKSDVKLRCINIIRDYFNIDKMQFRQPINTPDLEYEMMGIEGVRSVNWVELTQDFQQLVNGSLSGIISDVLYDIDLDGTEITGTGHSGKYGYKYDFHQFYGELDDTDEAITQVRNDGIVLPSVTPSVFELKYPNENIKGIVR